MVNADALQVYRELRVLTARPGPADEARAPHRLYGVLSARERCSAARWRGLAVAEAERPEAGPAVFCGGTGFYLEALLRGLSALPETPPEVEAAGRARLAELGAGAFHREVAARDPALARRVPAGDRQRLLRAWTVFEATGRPLSQWQADPREPGLPARTVLLDPPRERLRERIGARFRAMLAEGALEEAARLRDLDPALPAAKALGLRELQAHLDGELTLAEAEARAVAATGRFAKRQQTWFRHRFPADIAFEEEPNPALAEGLLAQLGIAARGADSERAEKQPVDRQIGGD